MRIIDQSHEILSLPENCLKSIEIAGRTCYKTESRITDISAGSFVSNLISRKHFAMIEFGDITVRFITNRGVTHELVRHRLCSFAQESTRYVKYDGEMEFIRPVWGNFTDSVIFAIQGDCPEARWIDAMESAERTYQVLLNQGWRPEQAREVLPNSLKTEIVVKANVREWRHIFSLRCAKAAHPQMRALMIPLLEELQMKVPTVFNDIYF